MILVGGVAHMARRSGGHDSEIALAGYELLARVQRQNRAAAEEIITHPSVGAWALNTLRGDQTVPGARPGGLATVAAAAAIRAGTDAKIEVPVVDNSVLLPSLGAATAVGPTAIIHTKRAEIRSAGLSVRAHSGAPGWQVMRRARAGSLDVLIDDLDPFRMPVPDGEPAARLALAEVAELTAMLRDAWTVLAPDSAGEIAATIRVIVPFQGPKAGYVSTSSPNAFGTVAMSPQPDKYTCAETLVHETQHLKLCALLDLVPLTRPDDGQRYYAPWRADPRPASGLLQGAYAFLGVGGFWREQRTAAPETRVRQRAQAEFARWREGAALAVGTLVDSGQLTPAGMDFVTEMAGVLAAWRREDVPGDAIMLARQQADRHRAQWHADNGPGPPLPQ
jgi:HEXXH motif-containing protein